MMSGDSLDSIEVFYCYAQQDEELREALEKHLGALKRSSLIRDWHHRDIQIGTNWKQAVDEHLNRAQIILLLISSDFIDSDYCYSVEMQRALERHEQGEARVIPVILRTVDLEDTPIASLRPLPTNGKPITSWPDQDEAFTDVSKGMRRVIRELKATSAKTEELPVDPLEQAFGKLGSSLPFVEWQTLMEIRERQICRIIIQGREKDYGTGFLLGPDVVMTNYHVLKDVIDGFIPSSSVSLHFDYKLKEDGETLDTSSEHRLPDTFWLLDHSENSDLDRQSAERWIDVEERHLDYALLRIAREAGKETVNGVMRRWINIQEIEYAFTSGTPLLILDHPNEDILAFDQDTRSVIETNANKTRVRYTTNGASGAPCFDVNWQLVALHQSGDPNFSHSTQYNQGIPIATILRRLKQQGKERYLLCEQEELRCEQKEKKGKDPPVWDPLSVQFEVPECMMSEDAQHQLALLLGKQLLYTSDPPGPIPITAVGKIIELSRRKRPTSVREFNTSTNRRKVTIDMLEQIDSKQLRWHLHLLFEGYMEATTSLIKKAKKPFDRLADLLPGDFKGTSEQLDLAEECLRKICTLSKRANQFLSPSIVNQITIEADRLIEEKGQFCQLLDEGNTTIHTRPGHRATIKSKFTGFEKRLKEFLHKLPKN